MILSPLFVKIIERGNFGDFFCMVNIAKFRNLQGCFTGFVIRTPLKMSSFVFFSYVKVILRKGG